mmetsp:Transcript_105531/g.268107  ORF Transcript_105531/g.268107 Transcript_105531/m.268107 type:complete len:247 (-) Transcript_105531:131-871(-)
MKIDLRLALRLGLRLQHGPLRPRLAAGRRQRRWRPSLVLPSPRLECSIHLCLLALVEGVPDGVQCSLHHHLLLRRRLSLPEPFRRLCGHHLVLLLLLLRREPCHLQQHRVSRCKQLHEVLVRDFPVALGVHHADHLVQLLVRGPLAHDREQVPELRHSDEAVAFVVDLPKSLRDVALLNPWQACDPLEPGVGSGKDRDNIGTARHARDGHGGGRGDDRFSSRDDGQPGGEDLGFRRIRRQRPQVWP